MPKISIQALGVDAASVKAITTDPVAGAILWYFVHDTPDSGFSVASIRELAKVTNQSPKVIKLRLDRLVLLELIEKITPDFHVPNKIGVYRLNMESPMFVKSRVAKKHIGNESLETPQIESMIEWFITINKNVHGSDFRPAPAKRVEWAKAARKILSMELNNQFVSVELFEKVTAFTAQHWKQYMEGDKYALQVPDLVNLASQNKHDSKPKFYKAYYKMMNASNVSPNAITSNKELLRKRHGDKTASGPDGNEDGRDLRPKTNLRRIAGDME